MGRWLACALACLGCADRVMISSAPPPPFAGPPNVVLILADDLGWGDLSCYGSATIRTPRLDGMAAGGARLTSFYVPSPVCAPSRASLLTGRWAPRTGISWNPPKRLNADELTLADLLRTRGYATAMLGKWHLGWDRDDMPVHHGFDSYWGLPYGDDGGDFVEDDRPAQGPSPEMLTREYAERSARLVRELPRPFLLYIAHRNPHLPPRPHPDFAGRSLHGAYSDAVEELDWSVGLVLDAIRDAGLERETVVLFSSDNGPEQDDGSAGPFSGHKRQVLEGGIRVPGIVWWPGRIPAAVLDEPASTLDVLPTLLAWAGGALTTDRAYDGQDIGSLLEGRVATGKVLLTP